MDGLSDELLSLILEYTTPSELLRSVVLVQKTWTALIKDELFWRNHVLLRTASCNLGSQQNLLNKRHIQQCCLYLAPAPLVGVTSLLPTRCQAKLARQQGLGRVCAASTTNHFVADDLENVLQNDFFSKDGEDDLSGWWSSRPSNTHTSTESLLFSTTHAVNLVSSVSIKPRCAVNAVYSWKKTCIRAYLVESDNDASMLQAGREDCDEGVVQTYMNAHGRSGTHQDAITKFVMSHKPVYESPVMDAGDGLLQYQLPNVVANVILLELIGKNQEPKQGMGYYACVEQVFMHGTPIIDEL